VDRFVATIIDDSALWRRSRRPDAVRRHGRPRPDARPPVGSHAEKW